jgi:hypothetical protein
MNSDGSLVPVSTTGNGRKGNGHGGNGHAIGA